MKKILTILVAVFLTASVFAQSPEKMSYQAVIRDASNNFVTNQTVGMQISIYHWSDDDTAEYVETHTPRTNANGLVSIEIGNGTVESGNFTTIDWANGPYFIKTETDPAGGTNYTIEGLSQLLSVPYALHAKTAETLSGEITETDPIFGASVASDITETDTTSWNNKQDQLTAGSGIDISGNVISTTSNVTTYSVGDFAQGGIVFWVDETGQHGLVAAKEDQDGGNGIQWRNGISTFTEARGDGVYAGKMNTMLIIANQGNDSDDYAAGVCANYYNDTEQGMAYGDWYLPSRFELILMNQYWETIDSTAVANGGSSFASDFYWSSTEGGSIGASVGNFHDNELNYYAKGNKCRVRAIRAF